MESNQVEGGQNNEGVGFLLLVASDPCTVRMPISSSFGDAPREERRSKAGVPWNRLKAQTCTSILVKKNIEEESGGQTGSPSILIAGWKPSLVYLPDDERGSVPSRQADGSFMVTACKPPSLKPTTSVVAWLELLDGTQVP